MNSGGRKETTEVEERLVGCRPVFLHKKKEKLRANWAFRTSNQKTQELSCTVLTQLVPAIQAAHVRTYHIFTARIDDDVGELRAAAASGSTGRRLRRPLSRLDVSSSRARRLGCPFVWLG